MTKSSMIILFTAFVALSAFKLPVKEKLATTLERVKGKPSGTKNAANLTFKVDNNTSKLSWLSKKATGQHSGQVKLSSGNFEVSDNLLKSGNFEIDMNTINCEDITDKKSNEKLIGVLKSETFFNIPTFSKANFTITTATKTSGNQYLIKGNLTIKGNKLNATGKITVDRSKYDIRFHSENFFENLGDKVIYNTFDITVNLNASSQ